MTGRRAVAILDRGLDVLGRVQGAGGAARPAASSSQLGGLKP